MLDASDLGGEPLQESDRCVEKTPPLKSVEKDMRCVIEKNDCHTDGEGDHCLKKDECCTAKNKKVDCPADTNPNRADEMVSCINTKHHTCCSV